MVPFFRLQCGGGGPAPVCIWGPQIPPPRKVRNRNQSPPTLTKDGGFRDHVSRCPSARPPSAIMASVPWAHRIQRNDLCGYDRWPEAVSAWWWGKHRACAPCSSHLQAQRHCAQDGLKLQPLSPDSGSSCISAVTTWSFLIPQWRIQTDLEVGPWNWPHEFTASRTYQGLSQGALGTLSGQHLVLDAQFCPCPLSRGVTWRWGLARLCLSPNLELVLGATRTPTLCLPPLQTQESPRQPSHGTQGAREAGEHSSQGGGEGVE